MRYIAGQKSSFQFFTEKAGVFVIVEIINPNFFGNFELAEWP
jgi:hypothetical protein